MPGRMPTEHNLLSSLREISITETATLRHHRLHYPLRRRSHGFACRVSSSVSQCRRAPMEEQAPGYLDDFELFCAHAQGGVGDGKHSKAASCVQSLPCTPESNGRARVRRVSTGGGPRRKQLLQRTENFDIAASDEPVFYDFVNKQQQQQQRRNNRRTVGSPSRRCASQKEQPLAATPSLRAIKRNAMRSKTMAENLAVASSPSAPSSPTRTATPTTSPVAPRLRPGYRRPKTGLNRSMTTDAGTPRLDDTQTDGDRKIFRVRSFYTTRRGVINQGDTFKLIYPKVTGDGQPSPPPPSKGRWQRVTKSAVTKEKLDQCTDKYKSLAVHDRAKDNISVFHVHVLGSHGVGKTTLVQQLMTSEYLGDQDNPPGR